MRFVQFMPCYGLFRDYSRPDIIKAIVNGLSIAYQVWRSTNFTFDARCIFWPFQVSGNDDGDIYLAKLARSVHTFNCPPGVWTSTAADLCEIKVASRDAIFLHLSHRLLHAPGWH